MNPRGLGSNEVFERSKSIESTLGLSNEAVNIKRNLSFDASAKVARRPFQVGRIDDSVTADKGLVTLNCLLILFL